MEALAKKRDKLLEYILHGEFSDRDFLSINASISSVLDEKNLQLARCQSELERQSNMGDKVQQIRDSLGRLAELNSPAMITEDFVKYCIDRIDIRAEGDVMKLTISLVTGKIAEKQLELLRPGNRRFVI